MFPTCSPIKCSTLSGAMTFLESDPRDDPVGMDPDEPPDARDGKPSRRLSLDLCSANGFRVTRRLGGSLISSASKMEGKVVLVTLRAPSSPSCTAPRPGLIFWPMLADLTEDVMRSPMSLASSYFFSRRRISGSSCLVDILATGARPSRLGGREKGSFVDSW